MKRFIVEIPDNDTDDSNRLPSDDVLCEAIRYACSTLDLEGGERLYLDARVTGLLPSERATGGDPLTVEAIVACLGDDAASIRDGTPLVCAEWADIMDDAARALEFMHSAGKDIVNTLENHHAAAKGNTRVHFALMRAKAIINYGSNE